MADKYFSVVLTVDLSCDKCHDKIKKVLSKYEDRWNIRSVVWDEKHNKVTLTGPFCPRKLSKKLCNKASKVIKSYDIPDLCDCDGKDKPPEPKKDLPKPAPAKAAEPPKKDPPKPAETPKPAPAKPDGPKKDTPKPENPKPAAPPPPAPKADKPAPAPPQPKPAEELISPVAVPDPYPPVWPVCFGGPWCQCGAGGGYAPWGCNCGCGHGGGGGGHGCGRSCHGGCQVEFFCEEESSCRPM